MRIPQKQELARLIYESLVASDKDCGGSWSAVRSEWTCVGLDGSFDFESVAEAVLKRFADEQINGLNREPTTGAIR